MKKTTKISSKIIHNAVSDYRDNNLSPSACSEKYGIGVTTLYRYLDKYGIIRHNSCIHRIYDRSYFHNIDSEEKAYWLGFICADGCVTHNPWSVELALSVKDKIHLRKFLSCISSQNVEIKDRIVNTSSFIKTHRISSRVVLSSKEMCIDLSQYGVVPRKTYTYSFPKQLSPKYYSHYLRGYFDGDGCITTAGVETTGYQYYHLSLMATKSFLKSYMKILYDELDISYIKLRKVSSQYIWAKKGMIQIRKILEYLYGESSIYLDRKYQLFLDVCRSKQ